MKSAKCDRCGGSLLFQQELGGRCVRCLLELGVLENTQGLEAEEPSNAADHLNVGTCVGRYRIFRLIGEGGMGVVYEAEQEQPRRHVALKLIRLGITGKATLRRFERETQALGRLQHPGIAQIYDAGAADAGFGPQPFFAMELIRGITPDEYAKQHRLSVRERLELVAKVAEAVHHAHQRGIIHRDLKPSNILVDEAGQPKVLDFGVSRPIDDDSTPRTRQTEMGQLLGTVAYMSPEQVMGDPHEVDVRTDIYALGVILYELLADRRPYEVEGSLQEALTAVREAEPTPLGTLVRDYRGDIETIAAKALEKDKNRRYTSAAELAADIRRFLAEEPIIARPPTAAYQLKKFARRNKVLVTAATMVILTLVLGVIFSAWQARKARLAEQVAVVDRDRALKAESMATEQRNVALDAQQQARAAEQTASAERDRAQTAEEQARREARVANTQRLVAITQYLVREALRPETARDDYDLASALVIQAQRFSARISAEPRQAVEDALQTALLWNPLRHHIATGGNSSYRTTAFSPDGMLLAAGGEDETVRVWNMGHPAESPRLLNAKGVDTQGISAVTFSNSGKLLAVGSLRPREATRGDTIRIWNMESREPPVVFQGAGNIDSLSFSPDDRYVISLTGGLFPWDTEPLLTLWDLRNPGAPRVLSREPLGLTSLPSSRVSYSPDGTRIAASFGSTVRVWDLQNPYAVPLSPRLPGTMSPTNPTGAVPSIHSVAFSPDGIHLATSSSLGVHIWDLGNLQRVPVALVLPPNEPQVRHLTYSRDGNRLAGVQGPIWIWDLRDPTARPSGYGNNNSAFVNGMAFSLDGARVAEATAFGVQVWDFSLVADPPTLSPRLPRNPPADPSVPIEPSEFVYSANLTRAVDATGDTLRLWDLRPTGPLATTLEPYPTTRESPYLAGKVNFCKKDTRVALSSRGQYGFGFPLSVWDLDGVKPRRIRTLDLLDTNYTHTLVACSPDGALLAIADQQKRIVRIIDSTGLDGFVDPVEILLHGPFKGTNYSKRIIPMPLRAAALLFSPDGNTLAIATPQAAHLWSWQDFNAAALVLTMPSSKLPPTLAFSSDGTWFAASPSTNVGMAAVWDLRNPRVPALQIPAGRVMTFSHDGNRLATSTGDNLRIWDLRNTGAPPLNLQWKGGTIIGLSFTPDNLVLKVGDLDGRIAQWRLWSAAADTLCTRVWRNLSMSEWKAHVGEGIPYERTCPNLPPGAGAPTGANSSGLRAEDL